MRLAPKARQTVLFSATMTEEVQRLATLSLRQPVRLAADEPSCAPVRLSQEVLRLKARLQPTHQSSTPSQQFAGCAPGPVGLSLHESSPYADLGPSSSNLGAPCGLGFVHFAGVRESWTCCGLDTLCAGLLVTSRIA